MATLVGMLIVGAQPLWIAKASERAPAIGREAGLRTCSRPAETLALLRAILRPAGNRRRSDGGSDVARTRCEPDGAAAQPVVGQSFTFDPDVRLVLVPVRIGKKEYPFVLDTGCTRSVVDVSLRPYLGERIETARISDAAGKQMALDLYAAPDARLGPGNK